MNNDSDPIRYPALWRRFAALIYDSFLLVALSMAYGGAALAINRLLLGSEQEFVTGPLFELGWVLILWGFYCYFWMRAGQTLGMRAWHLQVVSTKTASHPTLLQCLCRCLLAPVGLLLCVSSLFRHDRQCLHDLASTTTLQQLNHKSKNKTH